MNEWKMTTLGKISNTFTGFPFKSKFYENEGEYNVVRGDNIKEKTIKWADKKKWKKRILPVQNCHFS